MPYFYLTFNKGGYFLGGLIAYRLIKRVNEGRGKRDIAWN